MKKTLLLSLLIFVTACSQDRWTEGFQYYGFKDGYKTNVLYKTGGYTKLEINVSSEIYKELTYPLTLNVYLNDNICSTKTLASSKKQLLLSATCEKYLGPGNHILKASLVSPDNFKNISIDKDREHNHYHGSITYTLEE